MQQEFPKFSDEEQLKAENDFLKMKLMLERGGQFGGNENEVLPPEIENQFLNNIMAFEKQFEERKTIKVFDKIGKPQHFKAVGEIPDGDIDEAWNELSNYMAEHGVNLGVCSPNISARELYRFATEELFEHETDDINLPGWTTNFIYDEFYPDPVYDNSHLVERDLMWDIFRKDELFHDIHYDGDGFVFNDKLYKDFTEYSNRVSKFKSLFDEIELKKCTVNFCEVKEMDCEVRGEYMASAKTGSNEQIYSGGFKVELILKDSEYWYFKNIQIEGFRLE